MNYFNYPYGYGYWSEIDYENYLRQMQNVNPPPAHGGGQHGSQPPALGGGQHGSQPPAHGGGQHGYPAPPPHGGGHDHGYPPPPSHGGGHDHGYPPHGGGPHYDGPPTAPPPTFIPHETVGVYAVDPGGIRHCLYRYTYIWLNNGRSFWYYPTYVGRTSIAGYRWRGHHWEYYGMDLRQIRSFSCQ